MKKIPKQEREKKKQQQTLDGHKDSRLIIINWLKVNRFGRKMMAINEEAGR